MIETFRKQFALAILIGAIGAIAGCGGRPKEPGESDYSGFTGNLTAIEEANLNQAIGAAKRAMTSLALKPMIADRDGLTAKILGEVTKGALDQSHEVVVRLKSLSETRTEIELGIRGRRDQDLLQRILAEIRKELKG